MKIRSLIPVTVLAFSLVLLLAHLGDSAHPNTGLSRWVNTDRSLPDAEQHWTSLSMNTDTVMSTGFEVSNRVVKIPVAHMSMTDVTKSPSWFAHDSIVKIHYRGRELFKETSLKQLALNKDGDITFWNFAGLDWFDIDLLRSTEEQVVCQFSYRNKLNDERRNYVWIVNRTGYTCIEEV